MRSKRTDLNENGGCYEQDRETRAIQEDRETAKAGAESIDSGTGGASHQSDEADWAWLLDSDWNPRVTYYTNKDT